MNSDKNSSSKNSRDHQSPILNFHQNSLNLRALKSLLEKYFQSSTTRFPTFLDRRGILLLLTLFILLLPVFFIFKVGIGSIGQEGVLWEHLYQTMLPLYITNTLILMAGSGFLATLFGLVSAWTVTFYQFPGRHLLVWVLFLPFAFPSYLIAYIYTDFLDFPGPVQTTLRSLMGWGPQDYWFPEIRSLTGAIFLFSFNLYPYVYMFARKAFLEQSHLLKQAGQVFGLSPRQMFFRISWPLTRPSVIVGVFLVMMEVLADFGTVSYFSIATLSLGAYNFWINMGSLEGAIQIAILTLVLIMLMISLEKWQRSKKRHIENHQHPLIRKNLTPLKSFLALSVNVGLVLIGFVLPFIILLRLSILSLGSENSESTLSEYLLHSWNSVGLALGIATLSTVIAYLIVKGVVTHRSRGIQASFSIFSIGYALPGTILGIGVIPVVMYFNNIIGDVIFIGGTLFAVIYAYIIRFLTIPIGSIESGHRKISENIYLAAKILGKSTWERIFFIDIPLLRKCILTSFIIVFVDVMKELPLMIILRPLNYENLVTHVFTYASDENLGQASLSALTIVLLGLLPVILLTRSIDRSRESESNFIEWKR